jgi:ubiquinone/menaquinone biosynthesis C-methylase UbiE
MDFTNVYEDAKRAESYARLEFPGTYYLAYRDIPGIIAKHVTSPLTPLHMERGAKLKAIDFGCGTGRSTRYLKDRGFETTGADISADMLKIARELDNEGEYVLLDVSGLDVFKNRSFDLITAVFTFDNIPNVEYRTGLLKQLGSLLNSTGIIILVNSTPEIYVNEWLSFSTKDFPENKSAKGGDKVKIIMTDVVDKRPVEDIVWFDNDYRNLFAAAGLKLIETHKPLGKTSEPYEWVNETTIAPWVIYVLGK